MSSDDKNVISLDEIRAMRAQHVQGQASTNERRYSMEHAVEKFMLYRIVTSPRMKGALLKLIEPTSMPSQLGREVTRVCYLWHEKTGQWPANVLQAVRAAIDDEIIPGAVYEDMRKIISQVADSPDAHPSDDETLATMTEIARSKLARDVQMATMGLRADDLDRVRELLDKGAQISEGGAAPAQAKEDWPDIAGVAATLRIGTGIPEVDIVVPGGIPQGTLSVILADSSAGKGKVLAMIAALAAVESYLDVLFITLEDAIDDVKRCFAGIALGIDRRKLNVSGYETHSFLRKVFGSRLRIAELRGQATPAAINKLIDDAEKARGKPFGAVVLDYADLVEVPRKKKDDSYSMGRYVYEWMKSLAFDRGKWVWSASQTNRRNERYVKPVVLENVADSIHKVRIADLMIGFNQFREKGGTDFTHMFENLRNRNGEGVGEQTQMLERMLHFGRIVAIPDRIFAPWRHDVLDEIARLRSLGAQL